MRIIHVVAAATLSAFAAGALAQANAEGGKAPGPNPEFVKLDTNKDGFISRKEAEKNKGVLKVFDQADANKDGKLDEDEFLKAVSISQRGDAGRVARDTAITTKVKAALLAKEGFKSTSISVKTYNGRVSLSGAVDSRDQIAEAGRIVKDVSGVKSVQNNLAVKK